MNKNIFYIGLLLALPITSLKIEAVGYGEKETPDIRKTPKPKNPEKPKEKSPISIATQELMTIFKKDNLQDLEKFMNKYPNYKFNKLRNGRWTIEKSTALIDAITLNAKKCLQYLVDNKFTKTGLQTKSSHGYYPLDYALNPKINYSILDILVPKYTNPEKYINDKYQKDFVTYKNNKKYRNK